MLEPTQSRREEIVQRLTNAFVADCRFGPNASARLARIAIDALAAGGYLLPEGAELADKLRDIANYAETTGAYDRLHALADELDPE